MKRYRGLIVLLILLLTAMSCALAEGDPSEITLLFTSDIHSNIQARQTARDGQTVRLGSFARLKSAVDMNAVPGSTLLLDSGDFTMGTMYQAFCQTDALELRLMGMIGYDAIALGNHDFEVGEDGLASELSLFAGSEGACPVLCSNLVAAGQGASDAAADANPLSGSGVRNYAILERGGIRIGVFALMGYEAIQFTPVETFAFADPIETAKATVGLLREREKVDLVVLLSHCGTVPETFHEDEDIAKAVSGIDVILSGHAHVPLAEPLRVGDTLIVGAGTALSYLGKVTLRQEQGGWTLASYALLPIDDTYGADPAIEAAVAPYAEDLGRTYREQYGIQEDLGAPYAVSDVYFPGPDEMTAVSQCQDYALGRFIGDAYKAAIQDLCGQSVQIVAEPVGVIRNGIYRGELTVTDLYNALSYGISPLDGTSGAPITLFYMNGAELYDLCEASISLTPFMGSVQMLFGGLRYTCCEARPILDRVYSVEVYDEETGRYVPVERNTDALYSVAASWTALQSVSLITDNTFGLMSMTPKDAQGKVLDTETLQRSAILTYRASDGGVRELKEWYALYTYLGTQEVDANGLHVISEAYGGSGGYLVKESASIGNFFRNPSKAAWVMLAALLVLAALVFGIVRLCAWGVARLRGKRRARSATDERRLGARG